MVIARQDNACHMKAIDLLADSIPALVAYFCFNTSIGSLRSNKYEMINGPLWKPNISIRKKGNDNCDTRIIVIACKNMLPLLTFIVSTKSQAFIILSNDNAMRCSWTGCD